MASIQSDRIVREGMGGFLNPPGHPEHDWQVASGSRRDPDLMSLSYAVAADNISEATKQAAKKLLSDYAENTPAIDSRPVILWLKRTLAYYKDCYRGDGPEPECWHAGKLHICKPFPRPAFFDENGSPLYRWARRARYELPPALGGTYCQGGHSLDEHAGVRFIRLFYPDYEPADSDWIVNCHACGHHLNAHANGDGGPCQTIIERDAYQFSRSSIKPDGLCTCEEFNV